MTPKTSIYEYARQGLALSADRTAIWFYGESISYLELFKKIDRVADNLYSLGVKKGTVVTVHLPNCPQAVIAVYAVAKLGGVCNMVHAQTPAAALRENMEFAESYVLFTSTKTEIKDFHNILLLIQTDVDNDDCGLYNKIPSACRTVLFDELNEKAAVSAPEFTGEETASHCALYMNSSGTTGASKTVLLSHEAINSTVESLNNMFYGEVLSDQVLLSVTPFYHSLGLVAEMHRVISCGAKLVMLKRWDRDLAIHLIENQSVNFMTGVPSMYLDLVRSPDFNSEKASSLRYCFIGGDSITWDLVETLDSRVGGKRVAFPGYGMTEVGSAACALTPKLDRKNSCGFPLKNIEIAVIDDSGSISSFGRGELVINSTGMMLGYLKNQQATDCTIFTQNGKKWLHTGDYGEIDKDGFVYFITRLKNVIIRKGYCIFPDDVEKVIRTCDCVRDVCVLGLPDAESQTQKVCAAIVLKSDVRAEAAKEEIEQACRRNLTRYSVPTVLHFLEQIPYTQTGKVDRGVLKTRLC